MGMFTMIVIGTLSAAEIMHILHSFSPKVLKRTLGYSVYIDIVFGFGFTALMAMTGTISGMAVAAISGAILTLILASTKKLIGYSKYDRKTKAWIDYAPTWTIESAGSLYGSIKSTGSGKLTEIKDRFLNAANDSSRVIAA